MAYRIGNEVRNNARQLLAVRFDIDRIIRDINVQSIACDFRVGIAQSAAGTYCLADIKLLFLEGKTFAVELYII